MSLLALFCAVDDFWQQWARQQQPKRTRRQPGLCNSEIMTIVIHFHHSGYRTFKAYYVQEVQRHLRAAFPRLVSYSRFVRLMPRVTDCLHAYLRSRQETSTGVAFIDSTPLRVCHNQRIPRHRVFRDSAERGKSSMGWFYGFKLHLVVNSVGALLNALCTPANIDDRKPVPTLVAGLHGKVFGDKGYLSAPLREILAHTGVHLVTDSRRNMSAVPLDPADQGMLRRRFLIETIFDQLKNDLHIDHTRHRSVANFFVNLWAGLVAYTHQSRKPSFSR